MVSTGVFQRGKTSQPSILMLSTEKQRFTKHVRCASCPGYSILGRRFPSFSFGIRCNSTTGSELAPLLSPLGHPSSHTQQHVSLKEVLQQLFYWARFSTAKARNPAKRVDSPLSSTEPMNPAQALSVRLSWNCYNYWPLCMYVRHVESVVPSTKFSIVCAACSSFRNHIALLGIFSYEALYH